MSVEVDPSSKPEMCFERGKLVFCQKCNKCHPQGQAGLGLSINDKPLPDALIRQQVRNPVEIVPAFDENEISDVDLQAIIDFLDRASKRRFLNSESSNNEIFFDMTWFVY